MTEMDERTTRDGSPISSEPLFDATIIVHRQPFFIHVLQRLIATIGTIFYTKGSIIITHRPEQHLLGMIRPHAGHQYR